jgi:2-polyprenyl-6-methoxyphenol hydroxylase-like FAD-dependent oxidoreductase
MTMACKLARYGVPVRIIDKAAHRTDKSKAPVVWSRTLELLDRGGPSAPFGDAGFKAEAVNIIAADKVIGRVSMESAPSPYPFGLMLPQYETERLLEERLAGLGISVERQVELTSFKSNADGVEAVLRDSDGREDGVSADWLLGCDGAHSAVRHGLGATFAGETLNSDWMLADVHMTGYPFPDSEVSVYWHRDGAFVIFQSLQAAIESLRTCPPSMRSIRQHQRWNRSRPSSIAGDPAG